MSTAIANRDGEVLLSATEVELVKKTVANGATDDELKLFLHDCRRQGVHPLDKLIHFTKRGGRYTPITSIDFMRMRAADTGELAGSDDPVYAFADGETVLPQSATVTVYRLVQGQRCPFTATARWAEYKPPSGQDHMWLKMPQLMLGKCAEALVLRKAFPKQLHGIYERAEMAQAGPEDTKQAREVNGPKAIAQPRPPIAEPKTPAPIVDEAPADEADTLLLLPEEDRAFVIAEIKKLGKTIPAGDKAEAATTYLGLGVSLEKADAAALNDLLAWCKARTRTK